MIQLEQSFKCVSVLLCGCALLPSLQIMVRPGGPRDPLPEATWFALLNSLSF